MEKRLLMELNNHNVFYIKLDNLRYYIAIPKKYKKTNICIELKNKMGNYDLDVNDEIWVLENIKNTYNYIDNYNITLVIPVLNEEEVSVLEKIDTSYFKTIDILLGNLINKSYSNLVENNIEVDNQIILVDNEKYKTFINWFTTRYRERIICKNLLELIRIFNVNATEYKKLESPGMTFVVGSYSTEVDAPKAIEPEVNAPVKNLKPQTSAGFGSYLLLAVITIVVSLVVIVIAFKYK